MPIELTPRAFNRMRKAFTPGEAKKAINKYIEDHRGDFSKTSKKLNIDGRAYKYNPDWIVTKTLRRQMFNTLFQKAGKEMSKTEAKKWRQRQIMTPAVVQDYRRVMSANRLQKFYRDHIQATVSEGESALKSHANTFEITKIQSRDFKGLLKVHLAEPELMKAFKETHNLKIQMDVVLKVEDDKGKEFDFPMRTRPYVVTSEDMLHSALASMVTEIELRFDEKAMRKSNLKIKETKGIRMHYTKYDPLKAGAFIALPDCIKNT